MREVKKREKYSKNRGNTNLKNKNVDKKTFKKVFFIQLIVVLLSVASYSALLDSEAAVAGKVRNIIKDAFVEDIEVNRVYKEIDNVIQNLREYNYFSLDY